MRSGRLVIWAFRFDYEYDFSNLVRVLWIITCLQETSLSLSCEASVSVEFSTLKSRFPYFWTRARWGESEKTGRSHTPSQI